MTQPGITLNGQPHPLAHATPLPDLLAALGLAGKPVVIERNQEALTPGEHARTVIEPGDRLEVVTLAAGG